MAFVPITKTLPIVQVDEDFRRQLKAMNEEAEQMKAGDKKTVQQAREEALQGTVTGDAETIQLVIGALPEEVEKPEFIDIGQPINPVDVPECPLLERPQIVKKIQIARAAIMQAGCHLAHVADTYRRTGNESHYEMVAAILVSLEAAQELAEALEAFV